MALAGELAKYVGGELTKITGKEVAKAGAKAGAKSALANLIADTETKSVAKATEKGILNGLVPPTARKLASGVELGSEAIPLFRGQTNRLDRLDYNKGLSPNSNGFFMTPNKAATDSWAGKGVVSVNADPNDIMTLDELRALKKSAERYFRDPKYQKEIYNTNPTQAEIFDALEAGDGYQELSRLTGKPFIERDGGQGTELGEIVFFPDTTPELTSRYNADLASGKNQWLAPTEDAVASETAVPAGTKIKFDKDLSIKSIDEPSRGRGWFADNRDNPHIAQAIKQSGADKYLGNPKINYSLAEEPDKTLYHGTPNKFEDFDESLPSVWFSDSDKNLRDTGLSISGGQNMNIMERQLPKDLKIADEDLADKLTKQQLQDRGYAGIAYTERGPNGDETYYEIFRPNETLKKLEAKQPAGYSNLISKAKGYKSLERFEKMNNPIKGSEIWGDKPTSIFQRDSRAVRINMFPNNAVKGTGITKQYLLNLLKDAYDQGITSIVPSYGSYTKEGASFMDHLAEQGWVKDTGKNGWKSYEISPKIAEWEKTDPLADIYNEAHNMPDVRMSYGYGGGHGSYDENVKRIGSSEVAPVREETLPDGWKELEKYMDTSNDRLSLAIGKPRSKITKQDLISFLDENGYDMEGTKDDLWKNALMCIDDMAVDDLYNAGGTAGEFLQQRLPFRHNDKLTDATNYYIGAKGRTGRLDAEYSDRLGIGRSNTPMSDSLVNPYSAAGGDYSEGAFGTSAAWATGENGVSTSAHERMHAWQDINKFDWDEEVGDAIDELRGELKKHYHDVDAIKKYWGNHKTDYYAEDVEQEARMLQSYLDNEGYTNTTRKNSERGTEWGDEIKPAFDKFFDKLRALSKKGIALPAIAGLVGIGASAKEKDDKSVDNIK